MSRPSLVAAGLSLLLVAAPAHAAPSASAALKAPGGAAMGSATFEDGPAGVLIRLDLQGLTPGWHGVHLHEKGDCSDAKFTSAGGHINHAPAKAPHGLLNPDGPDVGDLPNIHAGADGKAMAEIYSPFVSVKASKGRPGLLDADGSSLVVHAKADDYLTQPIGNSGDRVACGVIGAAGAAAK